MKIVALFLCVALALASCAPVAHPVMLKSVAAPQLKISHAIASNTSVILLWNANPWYQFITRYDVQYQYSVDGQLFSNWKTITGSTAVSWARTVPRGFYRFAVVSVSAYGSSPRSNTVSYVAP